MCPRLCLGHTPYSSNAPVFRPYLPHNLLWKALQGGKSVGKANWSPLFLPHWLTLQRLGERVSKLQNGMHTNLWCLIMRLRGFVLSKDTYDWIVDTWNEGNLLISQLSKRNLLSRLKRKDRMPGEGSREADYVIFMITLCDIIFRWWSCILSRDQNVCIDHEAFQKIVESATPDHNVTWNSLTLAHYVACVA
jgi:hypothetical protein